MERTPRETRCRPDFPAPLVWAERREHSLIQFYHRMCSPHKRAMTTTTEHCVVEAEPVQKGEKHFRSSFTRNSCHDHIPLPRTSYFNGLFRTLMLVTLLAGCHLI